MLTLPIIAEWDEQWHVSDKDGNVIELPRIVDGFEETGEK